MRERSVLTIGCFVLLVVLVAASFLPIVPSDAQDGTESADAVITQSGSTVKVTYKSHEPSSIDYPQGSDITVFDFGSVEGSLSIVFDGAIVGDLTLFNVRESDDFYRTISVDFTMKSGSIGQFSLISVDEGAASAIDTSYDRLFTVFRNAKMTFESGTVTEVCPTSDMVAVSTATYELGHGLSVDRFYPSGINGKYASVYATVNGADIGYMTNVSSRVGSVEYDIRTGSVSYLCIGANTEHSQSGYLSSMSTFIATGDVKVHIGSMSDVYRCIIGSGILSIPSILCNGERYTELIAHNVTIDAETTELMNTTAFFLDNGTNVYSLSDYRIGRTPSSVHLSDTCLYQRSIIDVYGADGIWPSPSSSDVSSGTSVYVNAYYTVPSGSVITVSDGGYVSNSGVIELSGSIINYGRFDSNGVILCFSDSSLIGSIGGKSIIAEAVHFTEPSDYPRVMVSKSAASIVFDSIQEVQSVGALLEGGYKTVSVESDASQSIVGSIFVLGLTSLTPPSAFEHSYRLDIVGIGSEALSKSKITVTLDTDNSKCTSVYVRNGDFYEVIATSEYSSSISFTADGETVFYTLTHESEDPPIPVFPSHFKLLDYILCALIVALGVTILYVLYRMRRKSDA